MTTKSTDRAVQPYLNFDGRCEEALEFYGKAIGAEVIMKMLFKESPVPPQPGMCNPGSGDKIMHASFRVGGSVILASDGRCQGKSEFSGIMLSLTASTEKDAESLFAALADGGKVQMPMEKTFFSPRFGMVEDRFGVGWMVLVRPEG